MKDQNDSNHNFLHQYYLDCKSKLADISVYELVNSFNRETTCNEWTGTRGSYLKALMETFDEKPIKYLEYALI